MAFTKDDLAVIVTCFTEKGWTGTLNIDYSILDILQELVLSMKEDVNRLQTSKIFRMLSETNSIMLMMMIRQREKLFCSGKGI